MCWYIQLYWYNCIIQLCWYNVNCGNTNWIEDLRMCYYQILNYDNLFIHRAKIMWTGVIQIELKIWGCASSKTLVILIYLFVYVLFIIHFACSTIPQENEGLPGRLLKRGWRATSRSSLEQRSNPLAYFVASQAPPRSNV